MSVAGVTDSEWPASGAQKPRPGLSIEMLLQSGALQGPFRVTRPVTVSTWARIKRAVRTYINSQRKPSI